MLCYGARSRGHWKAYLIGLNGGNLLVLLDIVANGFGELLESALGYGLSHGRHLDDLVCIVPDKAGKSLAEDRRRAQMAHGRHARDDGYASRQHDGRVGAQNE